MPTYKKLPSGKWRARVRLPNGKRPGKTDPLKSVVRTWAEKLEADIRSGDWLDPAAGKKTVKAFYGEWWPPGYLGVHAKTSYERQAKLRVLPHWGRWQLSAVRPPDAVAWCEELDDEQKPRAAEIARNVASALFRDAVAKGLLRSNPFAGVYPAKSVRKPPRWFDDEESARLLAAFAPEDRLMVDLGLWTGLRWGELAALRGMRIDRLRKKVVVRDVLMYDGSLREYPKTDSSSREVPVPDHLVDVLVARAEDDLEAFLFQAPEGGPLLYHNWYGRVWARAVEKSGVAGTPHCMRHTAASRLVQRRVDLYRVRDLLGHKSIKTTEQYAHLAPDYHDAIEAAWRGPLVDHEAPGKAPEGCPRGGREAT